MTGPTPVPDGIDELWLQYTASRGQSLRDRLVLHYAPLVKYVAGRVGVGLPTHIDSGDLVQSGIFGLVDAIEKFDPERGWKFETYAMQRIRGAILDDLRSQDWVPRAVRSRAREAERALERLGARLACPQAHGSACPGVSVERGEGRRTGREGMPFKVNQLGHAWFLDAGRPRFLAEVTGGFVFPSDLAESAKEGTRG
jgi:RNA polymerase sigma factor (sigma-70 family)